MQKADRTNDEKYSNQQLDTVAIDKLYVVKVGLPAAFGIVILAFLVFVAALITDDSAAVSAFIYLTSLIVVIYATLVANLLL
jgi:hypothetical protein